MKKILLFLILCGISFIPSFVYADSDSSTLQVNYYPWSMDSPRNMEYLFLWLNDNSNTYIDSFKEDYDYYTIWVTSNATSNYVAYDIHYVLSNSEYTIMNCFSTNTNNRNCNFGLGIGSDLNTNNKYNKYMKFTIYKPTGSNYFYSSNTFINSNKITSISDSVRTINNTYDNPSLIPNTMYFMKSGSNGITDSSYVFPNNIYDNNVTLSNWRASSVSTYTSRNIYSYNVDTLEEIGTYTIGDVVPSYRQLFLSVPSYLQGYQKVTLHSGYQYYSISGVTSGNIYVPIESYQSYNPFLMYYQIGLEMQPYDNRVTQIQYTSDGEYIKIPYNYTDSVSYDLVMFSKYDYIEGVDNISYDIYIPSSAYVSQVSVTPNNNGGNDFSFDYTNSNGDIINESFSNSSDDIMKRNEFFSALFSNFTDNYFGLNAIISRPLDLLVHLTDDSCEEVTLVLPYINSVITLPCMDSIYSTYFGSFYTIYQYLISGFISYWILIDMVRLVKGFKDPAYDKIEVLRL